MFAGVDKVPNPFGSRSHALYSLVKKRQSMTGKVGMPGNRILSFIDRIDDDLKGHCHIKRLYYPLLTREMRPDSINSKG